MAAKKKQRSYSVDFKLNIFEEVEEKVLSKTEICKKYNIANSTLSTFLKNRKKIEQQNVSVSNGGARKRIREPVNLDVDEALYKWFLMARQNNIPLSGPLLMDKATKLAEQLGATDFKANAGWLQRFKVRKGIVSKVLCREAASVDTTVVANWKATLTNVLEGYSPDCVYNVDETGLFYRCLPNRTLTFKGESCHGGKLSKERLTLLLGANMDGSDKVEPLIIGRSANPRCFRGIKSVPLPYEANKSAWMTSTVWIKWIKGFNARMKRLNKSVLLFIDNCPAHPRVDKLSNVKVVYLPPQTTSHLQPCDQGIIQCFKRHYRYTLLQQYILAIENSEAFKPTVLDAMVYTEIAWKKVSADAIANCFRRFSVH